MTDIDPDQIDHDRVREVYEVVRLIRPLLAGRDPGVQSAVLAELLASWLAGYQGEGVAEFRQHAFGLFTEAVWKMVPAAEEMIARMLQEQ